MANNGSNSTRCGSSRGSWSGAASSAPPRISDCPPRPRPTPSSSSRPGSACGCCSARPGRCSPTLDGEAYYRRCLAILDDIEEAESAFSGARPRGLLRIDVQGAQARRVIVPALPRFFAEYPDLELFMGEGDRFVDLVREGVDCVLRAGELRESDLIARRVADIARGDGRLGRLRRPFRASPPLGRARRPSHDRLPLFGDRQRVAAGVHGRAASARP